MNETTCYPFLDGSRACFHSNVYPSYFSPKASVVDGFSDHHLSLALPIIGYWAVSLFFHTLDISGWKWVEKYRIHNVPSNQVRNVVTRTHVALAVIFQQIVQTALGLVSLPDDAIEFDHAGQMLAIASRAYPVMKVVLGSQNASNMLPDAAYYIYWWGIPVAQFFFGMYVLVFLMLINYALNGDTTQVRPRHMAILLASLHACQQVPVPKFPLLAPSSECSLCLQRIIQPSSRGLHL